MEVAIVIGGGNIFRGVQAAEGGMERTQGDYMGMLATMINAMALQSALEHIGVDTRLQSAIEMKAIAEPVIRRRAMRHLEKGRVVIFGAGTGNPFFTTDSAAVAARHRDRGGRDPEGHASTASIPQTRRRIRTRSASAALSFDEVFKRGLKVMDMTAFTLCNENKLPIIVFDINQPGNLLRIVEGEEVGTIVTV